MMKRTFVFFALLLSACAAPSLTDGEITAKLKEATAAAIAGASPAAIEISAPERLPAKWEWRASFDGKSFACDADDHMRLPSCTALDAASPT